MNARSIGIVVAIILMTHGCSDDPSGPDTTVVTAKDILNSPMGTIEVDGHTVIMQGSYFVVPEGAPLKVMGSLSDAEATVARMWFVSDPTKGKRLERDDDPQSCFLPDELCVSHVTKLKYAIGTEFVVALDVVASDGEILRVRSGVITVNASLP